MESVPFKNQSVFLYHSMLYTQSPLLKEIYCESHRYEPWAVHGDERRIGEYRFPNVLYVETALRERLLGAIPELLQERPGYAGLVMGRFRAASRALGSGLRRLPLRRDASVARALFDVTGRVLSSGVFKEAFEPAAALRFLGDLMPVAELRGDVLALYQPLCLPHFLKLELKLLHFASRLAATGKKVWVRRCIEQSAHLSRFLMEDTPLDEPEAMRAKLEELIEREGGRAEGVAERRRKLIRNHEDAVAASLRAERDILQRLDDFGRYTLRTKQVVMGCLTFIQFLATYEELKHIQTVQVARAFRMLMDREGLGVATTGSEDLWRALSTAARPARRPAARRKA
jgi:hypothetical protein